MLSNRNGNAIWGAGTDNKGSRAEFQNDGNLVIYDSYNKAIWSSNTSRRGGNKLTVQNDGNLVIYGNYSPVWSSGTQRLFLFHISYKRIGCPQGSLFFYFALINTSIFS